MSTRTVPKLVVAGALTGLLGLVAALGGCSGGLTTQEAYEACEELQKTVGDDSTFDDCVACFENCSDCVPSGTSPVTYHCPDDPAPSTSTGGTSSAASTGTGG
ncbi:MAG: hypothetical protein U0414_04620 [Polyangiaceae bacterium]